MNFRILPIVSAAELNDILPPQVRSLIAAIVPPLQNSDADCLSWAKENNGEFSIASAAHILQDPSTLTSLCSLLGVSSPLDCSCSAPLRITPLVAGLLLLRFTTVSVFSLSSSL
ncbi:hypothetical protein RIF29_34812 [Crotalaria pallida]|uniref:Uncharacterized protein n=1 Tax=Crotalaria pallida TaxID=3830 RepID=A0AAN9HUV0_CROPI